MMIKFKKINGMIERRKENFKNDNFSLFNRKEIDKNIKLRSGHDGSFLNR